MAWWTFNSDWLQSVHSFHWFISYQRYFSRHFEADFVHKTIIYEKEAWWIIWCKSHRSFLRWFWSVFTWRSCWRSPSKENLNRLGPLVFWSSDWVTADFLLTWCKASSYRYLRLGYHGTSNKYQLSGFFHQSGSSSVSKTEPNLKTSSFCFNYQSTICLL